MPLAPKRKANEVQHRSSSGTSSSLARRKITGPVHCDDETISLAAETEGESMVSLHLDPLILLFLRVNDNVLSLFRGVARLLHDFQSAQAVLPPQWKPTDSK